MSDTFTYDYHTPDSRLGSITLRLTNLEKAHNDLRLNLETGFDQMGNRAFAITTGLGGGEDEDSTAREAAQARLDELTESINTLRAERDTLRAEVDANKDDAKESAKA